MGFDAGKGRAKRLSAIAGRLMPSLDERQWNRERNAHTARYVATHDYAAILAGLENAVPSADRQPHLVVIPHEGPGHESYRAGTRNFYFEAAQAAREYFPDLRVTVFAVQPDESPAEWHTRLIRLAVETHATHLITHVESDPGHAGGAWTWDVLWSELSARWDGVLLGVMFDSAFRWITIQSRRLGRISPNFVAVDICMPMDGVMKKGRPEVGPVNMPMSDLSFELIDRRCDGLEKVWDVTLIGALYPYRVDLIDELRSHGVKVAVNPHRDDQTRDFDESRANQPSFLDYMAGLKQSHMTINFSRSSAGPYEQLKTRVIEASAMGCLVLTDDLHRTRLFWTPDEEFATFGDLAEIRTIVERYLADSDRLAEAQAAAQRRARAIAKSSFWGGIQDGLRTRGLPLLDVEGQPAAVKPG